MKNKHSILEKLLFGLAMTLMCYSIILGSRQINHTLMGVAFLLIALSSLSKVICFYKEANTIINTILLISIGLIILGATMYIYDWGLVGIAALGIVGFAITWQYSFLDNNSGIV